MVDYKSSFRQLKLQVNSNDIIIAPLRRIEAYFLCARKYTCLYLYASHMVVETGKFTSWIFHANRLWRLFSIVWAAVLKHTEYYVSNIFEIRIAAWTFLLCIRVILTLLIQNATTIFIMLLAMCRITEKRWIRVMNLGIPTYNFCNIGNIALCAFGVKFKYLKPSITFRCGGVFARFCVVFH